MAIFKTACAFGLYFVWNSMGEIEQGWGSRLIGSVIGALA